MKRIHFIFLFLILLCASCTNTVNHPKQTVPMSTLESVIKAQIKSDLIASGENTQTDFQGDILPDYNCAIMSDANFDILSEYDTSCLEDAVAVYPTDASLTDFIMVLRAQKDKVHEAITIAQAMGKSKTKDNVIKTIGNYILYITYKTPETIEKAIMRVIK